MSGTVCCYSGCTKRYSTDKDSVSFFKFPDDPKRRKKWMQNCGNTELESLSERQLRGKRICSDHFSPKSFVRPDVLSDTAVPIVAKPTPTPNPVKRAVPDEKSEEESPTPQKRARVGRPSAPSSSQPQVTSISDLAKSLLSKTSAPSQRQKSQQEATSSPSPASSPKKSTTPVATKSAPTPIVVKREVLEENTPTPQKRSGGRASLQPNSQPPVTSISDLAKNLLSKGHAPAQSPKAQPEVPPSPSRPSPKKTTAASATVTNLPVATKSVPAPTPGKQIGQEEKTVIEKATTTKKARGRASLQSNSLAQATSMSDLAKSLVSKRSVPSKLEGTASTSSPKNTAAASPTPTLATTKSTPTPTATKSGPTLVVAKPTPSPAKAKSPAPVETEKCSDEPESVTVSSVSLRDVGDNRSENNDGDGYDEYEYYDREFEYEFEEENESKVDREFERFYASLKKFLRLSGKWSMGGVQWDPQGKRKVIVISEPEIPPNGRPIVKRCLQFFEDKAVRVFLDGIDLTEVFGMTCYAEKEDVASLICKVAESTSCCGVPEMVQDDLVNFPNTKKRNTSYFDVDCPGIIPNDAFDPTCSACRNLQVLVLESREKEKKRLMERRLKSQGKEYKHPFGKAVYTMFNDLVDETDPAKPKKRRNKETFFRKFLHDTRYKMNGDTTKTERVYIEKPISVDSVSASFKDIVSKLGFNMPNAKKSKPAGTPLSRPPISSMGSRPGGRIGTGGLMKTNRAFPVDFAFPFSSGSSFTLDDGQEYELIGEVEPAATTDFMEVKPNPGQFEIIEVDSDTFVKLDSRNQVVMLPETTPNIVTRIDANDPNLSQILKAINSSQGFKV